MKPPRWLSRVVGLLVVVATIGLPFAGAQSPPGGNIVSRAGAVADLTALFGAIERIHPAPYFNRSRDLVETDRRQLIDALPETMTRIQWWMRLAPIVASLGDGHTEVPPPSASSNSSAR